MPVYDYECSDCGVFSDLVSMAYANQQQPCPHCDTMSQRVFLTAPMVMGMESHIRLAHATNEKAQNEPKSSRNHGSNCGCCKGPKLKSKNNQYNNVQNNTINAKSFPSKRPWMISH